MTERRAPAAAAPTAGDATRVAGLVVSIPSDGPTPAARVLVLQRDRIQFLGHPSDAARWLDPVLPAPHPPRGGARARGANPLRPPSGRPRSSLRGARHGEPPPGGARGRRADALAMLLRRRAAKRVAPSVHHPVTVIIRNPEGAPSPAAWSATCPSPGSASWSRSG